MVQYTFIKYKTECHRKTATSQYVTFTFYRAKQLKLLIFYERCLPEPLGKFPHSENNAIKSSSFRVILTNIRRIQMKFDCQQTKQEHNFFLFPVFGRQVRDERKKENSAVGKIERSTGEIVE